MDDSRKIVREFTITFIDGCFNYLFTDIRKLIEQDNDRILEIHKIHYLYLISWFLEAERARKLENDSLEQPDFGVIGGVLNQRAFIVVSKLMRESFEKGEFQNEDVCYASILCFKQIILTVKDMDKSLSDEDREIADNMKSRLFYEEQTLNMLLSIPRTAGKKNTAYIKECVELVHVVLKMLESFSKQHTVHFIRTRRKQRKKKAAVGGDVEEEHDIIDENEDDESRRITHERKFEFARFESKLINESTIDTYKRFLQNYKELSDREIMWAMSYLHRSFVKREARALFFSLDFMKILQDMTSTSSSGLPINSAIRKEVDRFLSYYMSKLIKALERTPSLYVELLFTKMPENWFYFDHGYEKPRESKGTARTAAVWVFKSTFGLDQERKVAIVIAALLDEDKGNMLEWLIQRIVEVRTKRQDGVVMNEILAVEDDKAKWVNKDGKFRLLLELLGFTLQDDGKCIIPSNINLDDLQNSEKWLKSSLFTPVTLDDDMVAADYLRRKRPNEINGDDSNNDSGLDDNDDTGMQYFIARDDDDGDDDDEDNLALRFADPRFNALPEDERLAKAITAEKDRARRQLFKKDLKNKKRKIDKETEKSRKSREKDNSLIEKEREKQRKIKSSAFVHDSDDDSDEERDKEFFESERKLRELLGRVNSGESGSQTNILNESQNRSAGGASSRTETPDPKYSEQSSETEMTPTNINISDSESEDYNNSHKTDNSDSYFKTSSTVNKRRAIIIDDDEDDE